MGGADLHAFVNRDMGSLAKIGISLSRNSGCLYDEVSHDSPSVPSMTSTIDFRPTISVQVEDLALH